MVTEVTRIDKTAITAIASSRRRPVGKAGLFNAHTSFRLSLSPTIHPATPKTANIHPFSQLKIPAAT
jgi:hypothetical protein